MAKYMTPSTRQMRSTAVGSSIHAQHGDGGAAGRISHNMQGQGCIQVESEQARAVGGRLCHTMSTRGPFLLVVGCVWLV